MEKLSIIVAVYNEEKNIRPLIDSVLKALGKSEIDYELIIVDDGSMDNTVKQIRDNRHKNVTLIELKRNFGQTAALKAGIDLADGDYIAPVDEPHLYGDVHDLLSAQVGHGASGQHVDGRVHVSGRYQLVAEELLDSRADRQDRVQLGVRQGPSRLLESGQDRWVLQVDRLNALDAEGKRD